MFTKSNYEWVIADIFSFGTVVHNTLTGVSEFIPAHILQLETHISKSMPLKFSDSCKRQELILSKLALFT